MPIFRFDVIIQASSGFPSDAIVNTWHFSKGSGSTTDYDNVRDMLADFYASTSTIGGSSTQTLASFMPTATTNATALVRAYEVGATPGAPPDYSSSFNLGARNAGTPLPSEVALCISFQAPREDGVNQARHRNRKYLGPFASIANGTDGRPVDNLVRTVVSQGRKLAAASDASVTWEWVIYSPTLGTSIAVDNGWVDNAWDTQRRRGKAPTARTLFTDALPAT